MFYRMRPDVNDPDKCIFEIMSTKTYPAASKVPRAVMQTVTDLEDPEQVLQIPRQDLGNIPRMQKGLHSKVIRQTWLAVEQEKIILNMHPVATVPPRIPVQVCIPPRLSHSNCDHCTVQRSEEHTSELQSLMRISYAVFCLKKKKHQHQR